jgi:hypothetical protein
MRRKKRNKNISLQDYYGIELPKKRKIKRWNFPIMDFPEDQNEDTIPKSQDVQGSGIGQEACGKASKGDAGKDFHD